MNLDKAEEAYRNDPMYRNVVDTLMGLVNTLQMSPSEIRETAMFACIKLERTKITPFIIQERNRQTNDLKG